VLVAIVRDPAAPVAARFAAPLEILDRGHGKSPHAHTGTDVGSPVSVVVRHIYEDAAAIQHPPQLRAV
jgi:hypothetical protein